MINYLNRLLAYLVSFSLIFQNSSYALKNTYEVEHIVVDGSTNTSIDRAQNGTPLMNTATVNSQGASLNNLEDFNIYSDNLIINNSLSVGNSVLGGTIYANPNFTNGRAASIIINQVTSNRRTNLKGFAEIFGNRAEMVIANPNGISVCGAGFINTSRLSLVTGQAEFENSGALKGFALSENGDINITGRDVIYSSGQNIYLGLDTQGASYTDLVSRVIKITANIFAGTELNLKTGNDYYNYQTKEVSSKEDVDPLEEGVAIDAAYFGAIRAGRINFIATEEGFAVKALSGVSADLDDITITAKGDVILNSVDAARDIKIATESELKNQEIILAENNAEINANIITNEEDAVIGAKNNITTNADNFDNHGEVTAENQMSLTSNILNNHNSVIAGHFLELKGNEVNNYDLFHSAGDLSIDLDGSLYNESLISAMADMDITTRGTRELGGENFAIKNHFGDIKSFHGNISLNAASGTIINNSAAISSAGNLTINAYHLLNKRDSVASSTEVQVGYRNSHRQYGNTWYEWRVAGVEAEESKIKSGGNILMNLHNLDNRYSIINSGSDLEINAHNITNKSLTYYTGERQFVVAKYPGHRAAAGYDCNIDRCWGGWDRWTNYGEKKNVQTHYQNAYIQAKGNLIGDITDHIDNNLIASNVIEANSVSASSDPLENQEDLIDLDDHIDLDNDPRGMFRKSRYDGLGIGFVIETRRQFLNLAGFYRTDYWVSRIGYNPDEIEQKIIGDIEYTAELISRNNKLNALISSGSVTDSVEEYTKSLYDNALDLDFAAIDVELGEELSPEQIATLEKDIVWLVSKIMVIDGVEQEVLVPKIYLSQKSQDLIAESNKAQGGFYAGKDLILKAKNGISSSAGMFSAGDNILLETAEGEINLNDTDLDAGGVAAILAGYGVNIASNQASPRPTPSYKTSNAKDDAATARSSATFNAGSDVLIDGGAGDVAIATNQLNSGGSIFVTAASGKISNDSNSLEANDNLIMTAKNITNGEAVLDMNKSQATLKAGQMVSLDATDGDITNSGAKIEAGTYAYLTATGDITNQAAKKGTQSGHYYNEELRAGEITASDVVMVAGGNITNRASDITSTGETYLEAGGDVTINTDTVTNSYYRGHDKGYNSRSTTTHQASNVSSGTDATIIAGGKAVIAGSNVTAGGDVSVSATGDIDVTSVLDESKYSDVYISRNSTVNHGRKLTHKGSEVKSTGGNIAINSDTDITSIASDIKADAGNLTLAAKGDVNILAGKNEESRNHRSWKKGGMFGGGGSYASSTNSTTNVASIADSGLVLSSNSGNDTNITASKLSSAGDMKIVTGYYEDAQGTKTINQDAALNIASAQDVSITETAYVDRNMTSYSKSETYDKTVTQISSSLNSGGNMNLQSAGDTTITASNIEAKNDIDVKTGTYQDVNGDTQTNSDAKLTIQAAKNTDYSYSKTESASLGFDVGEMFLGSVVTDMVSIATDNMDSLNSGTDNVVASAASAIEYEINQNENIDYNETIIASTIKAGGNANLNSQSDLTVTASDLEASNAILTSENGKVDILAATESDYSQSESLTTNFDITTGSRDGAAGVEVANLSGVKTDNINISKRGSNFDTTRTLTIAGNQDVNMVATDVKSGGNIAITSTAGEVNLVAGQEKSLNESTTMSGELGLFVSDQADFEFGEIRELERENMDITHQGTKIASAGNVTIGGEQDINLINSDVTALGNIDITSISGDINLGASQDIHYESETDRAFEYGVSIDHNLDMEGARIYETEHEKGSLTNRGTDIVSGGNITMSGNNISILNGDVSGNSGVDVTASDNLTIAALEDNSYERTSHREMKQYLDFELNTNEISAKSGMDVTIDKTSTSNRSVAESNINSSEGSINTDSTNDTNIIASNLVAAQDVNVDAGGDINMVTAKEIAEAQQRHLNIDAGVRIGSDHNIGQMMESIENLDQLGKVSPGDSANFPITFVSGLISGDLDDALDGNEDAINGLMRAIEFSQGGGSGGGSAAISVNVQVEGGKSRESSSTAKGSILMAGNDIDLTSANDINLEGSSVHAENDINLDAGNDINIRAAEHSSNSKLSAFNLEVDVDIFGSKGSGATDIALGINTEKSGRTSYSNSILNAGNNFNLTSGRDADMQGVNVRADNKVAMNIGGNLELASIQDHSRSENFSLDLSYGFGEDSSSYGSGFNAGKFKKDWVANQTSITGSNEVDISVGGNTHLQGSLIAQAKEVEIDDPNAKDGSKITILKDGGNLNLSTNSLTYENIYDIDKGRQFGISVGGGTNTKTRSNGKGGTATSTTEQSSYGFNYSSRDIRRNNNATIGNGTITIAGNSNPELEGLNRDIGKSQLITKKQVVDPVSGTIRFGSDTNVEVRDENGNVTKTYVVPSRLNMRGFDFARDAYYAATNLGEVINSGTRAELGEVNVRENQDKLANDPHGAHEMTAWDFGNDKLKSPLMSGILRTIGESAQLVQYGIWQRFTGDKESDYDINANYLADIYNDIDNTVRGTENLPINIEGTDGNFWYMEGGRLNEDGTTSPVTVPFGDRVNQKIDNDPKFKQDILKKHPDRTIIFNGSYSE